MFFHACLLIIIAFLDEMMIPVIIALACFIVKNIIDLCFAEIRRLVVSTIHFLIPHNFGRKGSKSSYFNFSAVNISFYFAY